MPLDKPDPRAIARFLIRRKAAPSDDADPSPEAGRAAFEAAFRDVAKWVGPIGAGALFSRAIVAARVSHPSLTDIELDRSLFALSGVEESVRVHGTSPTGAAIEALLTAHIELLSRLVGADLAERLVTSSSANPEPT